MTLVNLLFKCKQQEFQAMTLISVHFSLNISLNIKTFLNFNRFAQVSDYFCWQVFWAVKSSVFRPLILCEKTNKNGRKSKTHLSHMCIRRKILKTVIKSYYKGWVLYFNYTYFRNICAKKSVSHEPNIWNINFYFERRKLHRSQKKSARFASENKQIEQVISSTLLPKRAREGRIEFNTLLDTAHIYKNTLHAHQRRFSIHSSHNQCFPPVLPQIRSFSTLGKLRLKRKTHVQHVCDIPQPLNKQISNLEKNVEI